MILEAPARIITSHHHVGLVQLAQTPWEAPQFAVKSPAGQSIQSLLHAVEPVMTSSKGDLDIPGLE